MKKFLLVIAIAMSFLTGYSSAAGAWSWPYGRGEWYGYFYNQFDDWGDSVINSGIPTNINNADKFINFIKGKLSAGKDTWDGVGAAFIIQTMIGSSRNNPPNGGEIAEWEKRVRYADSQGWVRWDTKVSYRLNSYYQGVGSGSNPNDDAFYDQGVTKIDSGIEFTDGSKPVYQLRHACGNPVGVISPLKSAPQYNISGSSSVSKTSVVPGDWVLFTHKLTNSGPDAAPNMRYNVYDQYGNWKAGGGPFWLGAGWTNTVNTNWFNIPNNSLPGTQFCQHVHFWPQSDDGGSGDSPQACATVIAQFSLTPSVTASTTAAQQNDTVTFSYKVFNSGPTPSGPAPTDCKAVGGTHGPGYTPLPAQDADRNPDVGFGLGCPRHFLLGTTTMPTESVNIGNLSPGSRVCRSLVVNPKSQAGGPRSSAEACVVVAKTPYVHFLGNDVWAGGGFADVNPACNATSKIETSSHTLQNGTIAGSIDEYGAFALGKIANFGSASLAIVNPAGPVGKMLTFSNINSGNLGFYGAPQHCINSYISTYSGTPITGLPGTIVVDGQGSGTWQINGAHTFHGTMPTGGQQIYLVNGDVTIDTDLKYPDSYNKVSDIPSLVIISTGNILVKSATQQMDGLFVAKNTFNTCSDAPGGNLSINDCNKQLTVNGAVITGSLSLLRTYGADGNNDNTRKVPAEQFFFNPEMYIHSALLGPNSSTVHIVDQKALPPRY